MLCLLDVFSTTSNDLFCSYVVTWAHGDKFSIFCRYLQTADTSLIPGHLEYSLQSQWLGMIEKLLQKREFIFIDDVLAGVDVVFA